MLVKSEKNVELVKKKRKKKEETIDFRCIYKTSCRDGPKLIPLNFLLQFSPGNVANANPRGRVFTIYYIKYMELKRAKDGL